MILQIIGIILVVLIRFVILDILFVGFAPVCRFRSSRSKKVSDQLEFFNKHLL